MTTLAHRATLAETAVMSDTLDSRKMSLAASRGPFRAAAATFAFRGVARPRGNGPPAIRRARPMSGVPTLSRAQLHAPPRGGAWLPRRGNAGRLPEEPTWR